MPITPSRTENDPQAPLAWDTTVVLVALEKLRRARPIKKRERNAIKTVAEQVLLLSKAGQFPNRFSEVGSQGDIVSLPVDLHDSFFTLVAIGDKTSPIGRPPVLEKAGAYLHSIANHLESDTTSELDAVLLKETQDVCLQLLEHLNRQRPNNPER